MEVAFVTTKMRGGVVAICVHDHLARIINSPATTASAFHQVTRTTEWMIAAMTPTNEARQAVAPIIIVTGSWKKSTFLTQVVDQD